MKSETEIQAAMDRYGDMVEKICRLHLAQDADVQDVFQTVFLKYAQSRMFRDDEHEKAWLLKVTMNTCRDRFRGCFFHHVQLDDTIEEYSGEVNTSFYLLDALKQLPAHYRNALYLFYYEGYKVKEIAAILHKKENTIHTWLKRGKRELREVLGGDYDDFR